MSEFGDGYGYGDSGGPRFDTTSRAEAHRELMAIARILAEGLGLIQDGADATAFLREIAEDVKKIRETTEASHAAAEALRQQAQEFITQQEGKALAYTGQLPTQEQEDVFPFVSLPAGTKTRDLPDGNRLFTLPDGLLLRTTDDHQIWVAGEDPPRLLDPGPGTSLEVGPSRIFALDPSYLTLTHEAAGISGLPAETQPTNMGQGWQTIALPDGIRIDINHPERFLALINPNGPIDIIGLNRTEGIGEVINLHLISGGGQGFQCVLSGHGGLIEADGTIHLSLKTGRDLIVRFQNDTPDTEPYDGTGICGLACAPRDV